MSYLKLNRLFLFFFLIFNIVSFAAIENTEENEQLKKEFMKNVEKAIDKSFSGKCSSNLRTNSCDDIKDKVIGYANEYLEENLENHTYTEEEFLGNLDEYYLQGLKDVLKEDIDNDVFFTKDEKEEIKKEIDDAESEEEIKEYFEENEFKKVDKDDGGVSEWDNSEVVEKTEATEEASKSYSYSFSCVCSGVLSSAFSKLANKIIGDNLSKIPSKFSKNTEDIKVMTTQTKIETELIKLLEVELTGKIYVAKEVIDSLKKERNLSKD